MAKEVDSVAHLVKGGIYVYRDGPSRICVITRILKYDGYYGIRIEGVEKGIFWRANEFAGPRGGGLTQILQRIESPSVEEWL